jgi:1,2-phenylacetyl-CoA epoxidase PaaB subunit
LSFQVFTQKRAGDLWLSAGTIDAANPQAAIDVARQSIKQATSAHAIWVVAEDAILSTHHDLIWRHTDQSYRLARGYGREVRAKWIAFRDVSKLAEYEKDDLQDAF